MDFKCQQCGKKVSLKDFDEEWGICMDCAMKELDEIGTVSHEDSADEGMMVGASEVSCPECHGEGSCSDEGCPVCGLEYGAHVTLRLSRGNLDPAMDTSCLTCHGKGTDDNECPECGLKS